MKLTKREGSCRFGPRTSSHWVAFRSLSAVFARLTDLPANVRL